MSRNFRISNYAFTLLSVLGPAPLLALSQCQKPNHPCVPNSVINAATGIRDLIPFTYALSASDSFRARSPDTEPGIAPHEIGFEITRNGTALQHTSLSELPELRREEPEYASNFRAIAVTRACTNSGPIYFVTMQYMGDATSPTLYFTLVPAARGYKVSALPMISGGVLEVSTANDTLPHQDLG